MSGFFRCSVYVLLIEFAVLSLNSVLMHFINTKGMRNEVLHKMVPSENIY